MRAKAPANAGAVAEVEAETKSITDAECVNAPASAEGGDQSSLS